MSNSYILDPLTPLKASRMPGLAKGKFIPGHSNFLKHKGGEARWFDYEILNRLGEVRTWEEWRALGEVIVQSYPNYGKRGGTSAKLSADRMLYGMRKEGFFQEV